MLDVATDALQAKLTEGTISVRVHELDEGETFEIDTPEAAVAIVREGEYRVDVPAEGSTTTIVARTGMADVSSSNAQAVLRAGQVLRFPGGEVAAAPAPDASDAFAQERDRREETALASKQVSPRTIGYKDLAEYSDWRTDVTYGPVWVPRGVPPGWAPYRFGHWVWIEPWGWTWVDDAPWGLAPFHYGRWVLIGGVWIWVPGPYHRYPIYAPALVIFAGGGGPRVRFRPMMLTAAAVIVGSSVILFDPIFQGLAIALMAGEIASLLLSRMTVPVLFYVFNRNRSAAI